MRRGKLYRKLLIALILLMVQIWPTLTNNDVTTTICDDEPCYCDAFTRVICNCTLDYQEVTLRSEGAWRIPRTATAIILEGCARVYFLPDTLVSLPSLRSIALKKIRRLHIAENSLTWNFGRGERDHAISQGLRITIENSIIDEIASHAVRGRVDEIHLTNNTIYAMRPFCFSSLTGVKKVQLDDNIFHQIDTQVFKKFTTAEFMLIKGRINALPSRFLSDVEVLDLLQIDGATFGSISSLAFLVNSPKRVVVERNIIDTLEGDAFHIITKGSITFRNNTVNTIHKGAFYGFRSDQEIVSERGRQELLVDNNTVTIVAPNSFMYDQNTIKLRIDGLHMNITCRCSLAEEWSGVLFEQGGALSCIDPLEMRYMSLPTFIDSRCGVFKQRFWIFIIVGVVIAFIIAAVMVVIVFRRENEKRKKLQIVMPDGKTYRETEVHIVVERAELLTTDF